MIKEMMLQCPRSSWALQGHRWSQGKYILTVRPADGVTKAMLVNHGAASAVSLKADRSQEAGKHVMSNKMSAADTGSRLKSDRGQRRADRSYGD